MRSFKFNLGQIVYHKASGDKGVIVERHTRWCNESGGFHVPSGYYNVSWGPEKIETIHESMVDLDKDESN